MRKRNIFQVAFSIYEEPHFLTLPTSEFEIQDLLQRLHLNHENVKYPYGFRIQDNTKEYLEPAMLGKDVFKINKLAQKLSDMTEEKETAFEINIKNSMANGIFPDIDDLLTLASYQSENMVLHKGITNDEQLGRNMANHVIQEMSGKIEKWKDNKEISQQLFDVFGKLYRLEHKGCFTSQGFAECQDEQNTFMKQADDEQTGCISLIIFGDKNSAKLMLPANGNEKERVKSILGVQDLGLRYECSGCIIPALAPVISVIFPAKG